MGKSSRKWVAQRRARQQEAREFRAACEAGDPEALADPRYEKVMGKFGKKIGKGMNVDLDPPDWSAVNLEEIKKDFYQEHPLVTARDEAAIKEYRDKNKISVEGRNCPKPIQSLDECNFPESVMSAVKAKNFVTPTPIQSQVFPIALSGRDMVGIVEPGFGKSLAFLLPAITHIHGKNHPRNVGEPDVVVLAPNNEVAQKIHQDVVKLGPGIKVTSECFYGGGGGIKREEQRKYTDKVFEICIATPARLVDFVYEQLIKLHRCSYLVLDELDTMLSNGLGEKVEMIIEQARPDRQILMFSATWPPEIKGFAETYVKDYILLKISALQPSAWHNVTQKIEICEAADKPKRIAKIMGDVMKQKENKTLIFLNSKFDVDLLTLKFRMNGWKAEGLHGGKKQDEREKTCSDFKNGKIPIVIATDVAVRGFDMDDIKFVINYEYPTSSENYLHRIKRIGRGDSTGTAISLFTPSDRNGAEDLISILEEAGQHVPPELQNMTSLPRVTAAEPTPPGDKTRQLLVRLLRRGDINSTPLGTTTNTESLPEFEDTVDPDALAQAVTGRKSMKKSKLRIHNLIVKQIQGTPEGTDPPPAKVPRLAGAPNMHNSARKDVNSQRFSAGPSMPNESNSFFFDGMATGDRNVGRPNYSRNRRSNWDARNVGMSMNPRNYGSSWDAGNNYSRQKQAAAGWGNSAYSDYVGDQNSQSAEFRYDYRLSNAAMDRYSTPGSFGWYKQPPRRYDS